MRNRGQIVLGTALVLLGLMFLLGTVFRIDLWPFCWSIGLILAGVWLVLRPRLVEQGTGTEVTLIGDIHRRGDWVVRNEEFWLGIGDAELDLSQVVIPAGETTWRFYTFVGDVKVTVPREVGVSVRGTGIVVDSKLFERKHEAFFSSVEAVSENYMTADSRLRIEVIGFIADLKVRYL